MSMITTAVIGVGYLGKYHAEKYAALPSSDLVAVVDADEQIAREVAERCGCRALTDYRELLGEVEAVSVAVPTRLHYAITRDLLEHGCHVLVEKPITVTVAEAQELVDLARTRERVLQVGHLERFNPALLNLDRVSPSPVRFIESHRLAPYKPRGADVNVVLDLMIHDIDIILDIVRSDLARIDANGAKILGDAVDIANARLLFENGCVANVTASRVSTKTERKMRLFERDRYISIDFHNRILKVNCKGSNEAFPGIPEIISEEFVYERSDALMTEIEQFLASVAGGPPPLVSGEEGRRALDAAIRITELMQAETL